MIPIALAIIALLIESKFLCFFPVSIVAIGIQNMIFPFSFVTVDRPVGLRLLRGGTVVVAFTTVVTVA